MLLTVIACALLGLIVGSFLNVVIWRVPRGESVVRPRSHCPACGAAIAPRDEIPVVSWLLLRGRCRSCNTRISGRYAAVEVATALVFAALAVRFDEASSASANVRALPAFLYFGAIGVALAAIDLDTKRLPNALTLPAYVAGPAMLAGAALVGGEWSPFVRALCGLAAMYAVYFALALAYPAGMGFGDVKLSGVLGLFLGWLGWGIWAVGLFAGWLAGGLVGIALLATRRADRKTAIPFGPFMISGALFAVLAGGPVARAWLGS